MDQYFGQFLKNEAKRKKINRESNESKEKGKGSLESEQSTYAKSICEIAD